VSDSESGERRYHATSAPSERPDTQGKARAFSGASHAWRALRHRNFRLFFGGQTISLIGTWMTRIATSWLVYRLTGSALLLGTVSFAGQIPTFLVAPFAGVWVDRLNRRQVLVWTQTLSMIQSFLLAGLTLSGHITIELILILSVMQGIINAFDMPGRQSFMVQMVGDRADLGNAIAINSSMVNMARLIGPSLAGMLIAVTSEAATIRRKATSMLTELKEGWSYVADFLPIRTILSLFAVVSLMGMPFVVLMPIFAAKVLNGGPHTLGFLMGAMGVGALISALSLAARKNVRGLIRMIPIAAAVFGSGLSHAFWLSMLTVAVAGAGMMQGMAASNTIIQTLVTEDKRGRVMSYYTMAFMGMAPFGSLLAGSLAHLIPPTPMFLVKGTVLAGAQWTVILNGLVVVLGAAWFVTQLPALRRVVRPIYQEMGIIPAAREMATEQVQN
jgi:MFS family permease